MRRFYFRAVGGNVRGNPTMPSRKVRQDYKHMRDLGDILMFNEVSNPRYRAILRRVLGWAFIIGGMYRSETPIAVRRKRYRVLRRRVIKMHGGRVGASPTRRVVILIVQHRLTGIIFAIVCSHRVSGAWNNKLKRFKAWRKLMWLRHDTSEEVELLALYKQGISWVRFADYNRLGVELAHPNEKVILGQNNIVKMSFLEAPGGMTLKVLEKKMVRQVNTDHPFASAHFEGELD